MRRLLILSLLICGFWSCTEVEEDGKGTYRKSYLSSYRTPESIRINTSCSEIKFTITGSTVGSDVYKKLAKTYNDTSYNSYCVGAPRVAISEEICGIQLKTVDYFDASHPAGSDLSELVECSYLSYYDYIQSGYQKEEHDWMLYADSHLEEYFSIWGIKILKCTLSDINSTNTKLAAEDFVLEFNQEPEQKGIYQFKIVMQLPDRQIEAFCEHEF